MSFNPKGKKLADVSSKDVNKKSIDKLGKKYNNATGQQAPFFIKLDHKFADGATGPLFLFGKLNAFKAEIKEAVAKSPNEALRGLAYVDYGADGKSASTLVLAPVKGKLHTKTPLLTKAMKEAFTNAYASFKIGAEIDEKAAEALENAAENAADDDDKEEEPASNAPNATAAPKQDAATAKLSNVVSRIEQLLADMKAAQESGDAAKVAALDLEVRKAFAEVSPKK